MSERKYAAYSAAAALLVCCGVVYWQAHKYVAGYLDMTEWANPHTMTNITTGLVCIFLAFGAVLGYMLPKRVLHRLSPKKQRWAALCLTVLFTMAFCFFLSYAGVPGFKFR